MEICLRSFSIFLILASDWAQNIIASHEQSLYCISYLKQSKLTINKKYNQIQSTKNSEFTQIKIDDSWASRILSTLHPQLDENNYGRNRSAMERMNFILGTWRQRRRTRRRWSRSNRREDLAGRWPAPCTAAPPMVAADRCVATPSLWLSGVFLLLANG